MRVGLLLNGDGVAMPSQAAAPTLWIAVDGGMRHAAKLRVAPQLWFGDFDSSSSQLIEQYKNIKRFIAPCDKDETDLQLALNYVVNNYPKAQEIYLIGAQGDELDHFFANLWLLPQYSLPVIAWGAKQHVIFLPAATTLYLRGDEGEKVSVFALQPLSDVDYVGLRWQLKDKKLARFAICGARNEINAASASLCVQKGAALVFVTASILPTFQY